MNDIQTLPDVERVLSEHGYTPTLNENSVSLPVGAEESPFPCVILMDNTYLTVICEIDTWGRMMDRIPIDSREEFHLAMCDLNSRMNSYAFTVLSNIDDPDAGEDKNEWPVALINSVPVGDLSEAELLEGIRGLQAALLTAATLFNVNVKESAVEAL